MSVDFVGAFGIGSPALLVCEVVLLVSGTSGFWNFPFVSCHVPLQWGENYGNATCSSPYYTRFSERLQEAGAPPVK